MEEDWESETVSGTYDPAKATAGRDIIRKMPSGLSKTAKKKWRLQERLRREAIQEGRTPPTQPSTSTRPSSGRPAPAANHGRKPSSAASRSSTKPSSPPKSPAPSGTQKLDRFVPLFNVSNPSSYWATARDSYKEENFLTWRYGALLYELDRRFVACGVERNDRLRREDLPYVMQIDDLDEWEEFRDPFLSSIKAEKMVALDVEMKQGSDEPISVSVTSPLASVAIFNLKAWGGIEFLPADLCSALADSTAVGSGIKKDLETLGDKLEVWAVIDTQPAFVKFRDRDQTLYSEFERKKGLGAISRCIYGWDFKTNNFDALAAHEADPEKYPHPRVIWPSFGERTWQALYERDEDEPLTDLQLSYDRSDGAVSFGFLYKEGKDLLSTRVWQRRALVHRMTVPEVLIEASEAEQMLNRDLPDPWVTVSKEARYIHLGGGYRRRLLGTLAEPMKKDASCTAPDSDTILAETMGLRGASAGSSKHTGKKDDLNPVISVKVVEVEHEHEEAVIDDEDVDMENIISEPSTAGASTLPAVKGGCQTVSHESGPVDPDLQVGEREGTGESVEMEAGPSSANRADEPVSKRHRAHGQREPPAERRRRHKNRKERAQKEMSDLKEEVKKLKAALKEERMKNMQKRLGKK